MSTNFSKGTSLASSQKGSQPISLWGILFMAAHFPLALAIDRYHDIATIHAYATLVIGILIAISGRPFTQVAFAGAYITGAEVLWRMSKANIFWEYGKYATVLIFVIAMLRQGKLRIFSLPFLYFVLLLPSSSLSSEHQSWRIFSQSLSFNLSGPLALTVSALFFSQFEFSFEKLGKLYVVLTAPIIGILAIALTRTVGAEEIRFNSASNYITSGGFGPNQVSAILGLGALVSFLQILNSNLKGSYRILFFGLMMLLAVQSALTFSRGGLYMAVSAAIVAAVLSVKDSRSRIRFLLIAGVTLLIWIFVLSPRLNSFTGGALASRFENTSLTGRDKIMQADLEIWKENPLFGVGPGRAIVFREIYYNNKDAAAHTEYTRLLAEHGLFGFGSLLLLFIMSIQNVRKPQEPQSRAVKCVMISWSLLFLFVNGMRLAAPSFLFGFSFVTLFSEERLEAVKRYRLKVAYGKPVRTREVMP
jgi:O-antigen ligase